MQHQVATCRHFALARRAAVAVAITAGLAAPGYADRHHDDRGEVTTVLTFDPARGENPESLAIDRHGNIYVVLLFARTIVRLDEHGGQARVTLPGGLAAGVAIDPRRPDHLTVAVISPDPAIAGLWTVPFAAFAGGAAPSRAVALPTDSFPNGVTYDRDGNLYVADSNLARVWRVAAGASTATIWLADPALAPSGAKLGDFVLPGANGVKISRGQLYVSNTSTATLLATRIARDGSPGALVPVIENLFGLDDFLVTRRGEIIAALNGSNQVVAISPRGRIEILNDEARGCRNPSAVALDDDGGIYVTNAAFFSTGPSLQRIERE
jgi:outer membrane protein assembly factor BamB